MGFSFKSLFKPAKKIFKAVDTVITKPVTKGIVHVAKEGFEELIEKPGKKIIRETMDTLMNIDKYDRNPPEPEITPEVTPEIVPDEKPTITTRYATRGKRSGQGGTIMEGYGVTTRPKSKRAIT
jgi:hypothetical protein